MDLLKDHVHEIMLQQAITILGLILISDKSKFDVKFSYQIFTLMLTASRASQTHFG